MTPPKFSSPAHEALTQHKETLCLCIQLFEGWHTDTAWTEHDSKVYQGVLKLQQWLYALTEQSPPHDDLAKKLADCLRNIVATKAACKVLNRYDAAKE